MPRWTVTTRDGIEDVGADVLDVIGGALVFKDVTPSPYAERFEAMGRFAPPVETITVAYAPTRWLAVTRDEDDDPESAEHKDPHAHEWEDVTTFGDRDRVYACTSCGDTRTEAL